MPPGAFWLEIAIVSLEKASKLVSDREIHENKRSLNLSGKRFFILNWLQQDRFIKIGSDNRFRNWFSD